jgi:glycosyltransferase involved in cell wall biosynthesis
MNQTLLFLGTFPVDTSAGGGKYVINNLLRRVSSQYNVKFLSLVESDKIYKEVTVSQNFENIQIPQNIEQAKIQWDEENKNNVGLFDVIQINYWNYNSKYIEYFKKHLDNADAVILEHPYFANLVKSLNLKIPIIYHAIDLELNQKKSILNPKLLQDVKNVEQTACDLAKKIWASSESEKNQFLEIYGVAEDDIRILPHGVEMLAAPFIKRISHKEIKSKLEEISDKTTFVFTGSWHPPNLESLEFIISDLAPMNRNFLYFIVGSVRNFYLQKHSKAKIPENVILFGSVTDQEKIGIYKLSDFAINPMFSGAGTNLKMLEFMAVGLPIISTEFGARGLKISKNTLVCDKENFWKTIEFAYKSKFKESASISENHMIIKNEYDYNLISRKCISYLMELFDPKITHFKIFDMVLTELNNMQIKNNDELVDSLAKELEVLVNFKPIS